MSVTANENSLIHSAILINVATVGYAQPPEFNVDAYGQPSMEERIEYAVQNETKFLEAVEEEERKTWSLKERDGRRMWIPARRSLSRKLWRGVESWFGLEKARL